jgi:CubicO group peptidase (beta-lactamase class C family)
MPAGIDEFSGNIEDVDTPLLFEPGTKLNYGVSIHSFPFAPDTNLTLSKTNIDWAGILVERVTGMSLND